MQTYTADVIHSIVAIGPASFGLGPVAANLSLEQGRLGCNSRIWCLDDGNSIEWATKTYGLPSGAVRSFPKSWPSFLGFSLPMEKEAADRAGNTIGIVHQHGIWTGLSRVSNMMRDHGAPTVVTPHGSLQDWAVRKSWWKKKLALEWYEKRNLTEARCFHAVAEPEVADIRDFGLKNPVAVIPNGISPSWLESEGDAARFRQRFRIPADRRILLFLSRITPKKGLPMLLRALDSLRENSFSDWILVIAGADEFGHQAELLSQIRDLGLEKSVVFTGPLFDYSKRDAFEAAELFVLPSYSEGAPIVILESLAAGVPVIATKASPWQDLVTCRCGWWTDIDQSAIAEALEDALSMQASTLQEMGRKGRLLVSEKYTWQHAARMSIELYDWILGRRDKPAFVITD